MKKDVGGMSTSIGHIGHIVITRFSVPSTQPNRKRGVTMQPRISSCLLSFTAGLALFGLSGIPGSTGEAQAGIRTAAQPVTAQATAACLAQSAGCITGATEAFAVIQVRGASTGDRQCKRAIDNGCSKEQFPKPLPRPQ
jgi:hypothetical protein